MWELTTPDKQRYPLLFNEEYYLGRSIHTNKDVKNFIHISDKSVSRKHARISVTPDGSISLSDLNSKFSTRVYDEFGIEMKMQTFNKFNLSTSCTILLGKSPVLILQKNNVSPKSPFAKNIKSSRSRS